MKLFVREFVFGEVGKSLQGDNIKRNKLKVVCGGMGEPALAHQILCKNHRTGQA